MRILHVVTFLSGGAGKAALRLHHGLLSEGIDSRVLCITSESNVKNVTIAQSKWTLFDKVKNMMGLYSSVREAEVSFLSEVSDYYEYFSFCQSDVDVTSFDVYKSANIINLHWTAHLLDYYSFFKRTNKPVLWSLSDMNSFTGGCHFSNSCLKFISENCLNCAQLKGTTDVNRASKNLALKKKSLKKYKYNPVIVTPAKWLNNLAKKSEVFRGSKHLIIPHASDENIYYPLDKKTAKLSYNLPLNKVVFLFSSSDILSKRKGFQFLLEARKLLDNSEIHFLIIGDSNQMILGDQPNVTFTGYINDEKELLTIYNASDAVIIPSAEDNLPLTMIDSMMCGVPSISFNVGGMSDYITDGFNGYTAEQLNGESLAASINKFINNRNSFEVDKIHEFAFRNFNIKKHAKEYLVLYGEILENHLVTK